MLAMKVVCPFCSKRLKTKKPLDQGHRILCAQCNRSFAIGPDTAVFSAAQTQPALPPLPSAPSLESVAVEDPPAPTSAPPPALEAMKVPAAPPAASSVPPPLLPALGETLLPSEHEGRQECLPHAAQSSRGALMLTAVCAAVLLATGGAIVLCVRLADRKEDRQAQVGPQEVPAPLPAPAAAPEAKPEKKPEVKPAVTIPPADPVLPVPPPIAPPEQPPPLPPPVFRPPAPRVDPPAPEPPPLPPQPAQARQQAWLPPEEQDKVNKAIDRGVVYLKKTQVASGSWSANGNHVLGLAALPGLTLLECGVAPTDPRVLKAARVVRDLGRNNQQTYELALAILFLDRLGEPSDHALLQTLAMRLVAGQSEAGGWTYTCPILTPAQERNLVTVLRQRQHPPLEGELAGNGRKGPAGIATAPGVGDLGKTTQASKPPAAMVPGSTIPLPGPPELRPPAGREPQPQPGRDPRADAAAARKALDSLPAVMRRIPALHEPPTLDQAPPSDISDNSNTQFALLGVWVAGRHGVPTEKTLAHLARRFRLSQAPDGGWNYLYTVPGNASTPSMTGAGLLGLGVGLGLAVPENAGPDRKEKPPKDAAVEKGLHALAETIGKPLGLRPPVRVRPRGPGWGRPDVNLYFLWTLERVGVLYNLRHIDGKDWYRWGSEMLVDAQQADGAWTNGGYPGSQPEIDTCFALLFLKRANFVEDLSRRLEFVIDVRSMSTKP
jgi:hypothetical protein